MLQYQHYNIDFTIDLCSIYRPTVGGNPKEQNMFRLFNKKKSDNKTEQKIIPQSTETNLPFDLFFNSNNLPDNKKQEKVYLYEWLKNDGDWVDEGQPLYNIRAGEKIGIGLAFISNDLKAQRSGIIQQHKKKGDLINNGDKLYTIHPKGTYRLENTPLKESYRFHFDKFKYNIPEKYANHKLQINEWHKQDGELVRQGEIILTLGYQTSYGNNETINHYAEKDGYLDKIRTQLDFIGLNQNELVYVIHEKDENRIKRKFINTPDIKIDDFTGKKIIKWKQVGSNDGYTEGITSKSTDNKISFTFSFNNIDEKDFIVFQFYSKEIMLSKDDSVSFLFADNSIINFIINGSSYKASHPYIEKLFENKVQITDDELRHFETQQFLKWKIILRKQNREIIGGNEGSYQYESYNNLATVIKKFAKEYCELVRTEIANYKPLLERGTLISLTDIPIIEECYVYLMHDTNNHYHKIGISNKPEWREKTLQSEKPTIELIASKKFINRKIASGFEKALHNTYSNKRIRGEWFQLDLKEIEEIKITLNS